MICIVQVQPRKHVRDHADCTGPIRRHELDHTRWVVCLPCLTDLDHEEGIDDLDHTDHTDHDLSEVCRIDILPLSYFELTTQTRTHPPPLVLGDFFFDM